MTGDATSLVAVRLCAIIGGEGRDRMASARTVASLSLDAALLSEAEALKLDVNGAAEEGIARAVSAEKERLWKIEHADAIRAENAHLDNHGLPLSRFRRF